MRGKNDFSSISAIAAKIAENVRDLNEVTLNVAKNTLSEKVSRVSFLS